MWCSRRNTRIKKKLNPIKCLSLILFSLTAFYTYWLLQNGLSLIQSSSSHPNIQQDTEPIHTIAYAVSLTGCNAGLLGDGPAVLKHSIHLSSYPKHPHSRYAYKMFAFIHPSAISCSSIFTSLGYQTLITDTPVNVSDIRAEFLRQHVVKSGCCGEKEYIKLYSYTLTQYPIVVHLDLDSLVLQPMDDLFNAMLRPNSTLPDIMFGATLPKPKHLHAFFTRDYNMVNLNHPHVGVQGGFLVVKPNITAFEQYRQVILEGDFVEGVGWKGLYGGYFGAQQIQGICSYFYDGLHPGTGVELNRCIYNNMADAPTRSDKDGVEKCLDGKESCEDCRETNTSKIKSVHFTLCQKPWLCPTSSWDEKLELCKFFHSEWFRIRLDFEKSIGIQENNHGQHYVDVYKGFCTSNGQHGYIPLTLP